MTQSNEGRDRLAEIEQILMKISQQQATNTLEIHELKNAIEAERAEREAERVLREEQRGEVNAELAALRSNIADLVTVSQNLVKIVQNYQKRLDELEEKQ